MGDDLYMDLLTNPVFLMSIAIFIGLVIGRISIGRFRLGVSGILFAGIAVGEWAWRLAVGPYIRAYEAGQTDIPGFAARVLREGMVNKSYADLLLVLFVASVGLLAAKDVSKVFRGYGLRFLVLAAAITSAGALATYLQFRLISGVDRMAIAGVYTGALTSSPGLAVALETVTSLFADPASLAARSAQASVGLGYAIAYPFSVITVIMSIQLLPKIFRINVQSEVEALRNELAVASQSTTEQANSASFDIPAFMLVCIAGFLIGRIGVPLGSVGKISLETTGGVLAAALLLGGLGRLGPFNFRMSTQALDIVREIAVVYFLAYVGLNYGHQALQAIAGPNAVLLFVGLTSTLAALLSGFMVGRYVLKMNWVLLSGAICGGMTSTPGLGAAIDSTGSNDAAGGYGSTYPVGLLCKVILVLLLYKLPM